MFGAVEGGPEELQGSRIDVGEHPPQGETLMANCDCSSRNGLVSRPFTTQFYRFDFATRLAQNALVAFAIK